MKQNYFNCLIVLLLISSSVFSSTYINGEVEYFYMTRLKDSKLVNIPFRLLDFNVQHQINDNFNIFGNLGIEYRNRRDSDFMTDSNLEDFLLDLRELYMSYYFTNGEIRVGKQIHGWGNIDENSPIDNLNAYDYYYLLLGGSEKKLGAYSLAYDYTFCNTCDLKFSFVYSPMHNTNRIPINDPDYPIGLPSGANPSDETLLFLDNTPYEYGFNFKWSFAFGDISFSHLNLYDRIFNISGLTVYTDENQLGLRFETVPRYSYRATQAYNLGAVLLFDDFTFSFDHAKFITEDQNTIDDFSDLSNPNYDPNSPISALLNPSLFIKRAFEESATYYQTAIQVEIPFPKDIQLNMQYFKHELSSHYAQDLDITCETLTSLPAFTDDDCADLELELGFSLNNFNIENIFIPGVGFPYALITPEAVLINIEKVFPDNNLTLDLNTFLDASHGKGRLISLEIEYDIGNGFEISFGATKIYGDDDIENYSFNGMEDFSSFRSRITYYF